MVYSTVPLDSIAPPQFSSFSVLSLSLPISLSLSLVPAPRDEQVAVQCLIASVEFMGESSYIPEVYRAKTAQPQPASIFLLSSVCSTRCTYLCVFLRKAFTHAPISKHGPFDE